jgi:dUTP pyrophosphatase
MLKLLLKIDNGMEAYYKNEACNSNSENIGVDLFFDEDYLIPKGKKTTLKFGVKAEAINNDKNVAYLLVPRSSISKTTLFQVNSVGVIDAGYRGYIQACVYNYGNEDHFAKKGERLFQIVALNDGKPFDSIEIVETLSASQRGENGFGSTGV